MYLTKRLSYLSMCLVVAVLMFSPVAHAKDCSADTECKKGNVCYQGQCKKLRETESLLRVESTIPLQNPAFLYIDGAPMGTLPFEGIVPAGSHQIRVESPGMLPSAFVGNTESFQGYSIPVTLAPAPAPPPTTYGAPPATGSPSADPDPGRMFAGLDVGFQFGTASWGGPTEKRPAVGFFGSLVLGVAAVKKPVLLDLGLSIGTSSSRITEQWKGENIEWGEMIIPHFGLLIRCMFPVKKMLYLGFEIEPGYARGYDMSVGFTKWAYLYGQLSAAVSLFIKDFFEVRINPLGLEYLQEATIPDSMGYIISYQFSAGVVFRFL